MKMNNSKFIVVTSATFLLSLFCVSPTFASMNLEASAPVSGISIAINNYFARTREPEKNIAESIKMIKDAPIVIGEEDETKSKTAAQLLQEELETTAAEIVTEQGATYGIVHTSSTLRLREKANMDSTTLSLLSEGETYLVIGQEGDFYKIQDDDDLVGYVFKDYITTKVMTEAELEAERAARVAEAERRKKEAQEAMRKYEEALKAEEESRKADSKKETTKSEETKAVVVITPVETENNIVEKFSEATAEALPGGIESTIVVADPTASTTVSTKAPETTKATTASTKATTAAATSSYNSQGPGSIIGEETTKSSGKTTNKTTRLIGPGVSAQRNAIVAYALTFLGGKYVYGGTDLEGGTGVDCSGFTMRVYEKFGYNIGRTSRDQAANGTEISASQAKPGDLFFYSSGGTINHVAMYIGDGEVIHASSSTVGIVISGSNYRTPCKVCTFMY